MHAISMLTAHINRLAPQQQEQLDHVAKQHQLSPVIVTVTKHVA